MKDDLIRRQAAIEETWKEPSYTDPINVLTEVRDRIKALPSSQPEQKKGEWDYSDDMYETRVCSVCGFDTEDYKEYNFCPNCGADMRGEQDG